MRTFIGRQPFEERTRYFRSEELARAVKERIEEQSEEGFETTWDLSSTDGDSSATDGCGDVDRNDSYNLSATESDLSTTDGCGDVDRNGSHDLSATEGDLSETDGWDGRLTLTASDALSVKAKRRNVRHADLSKVEVKRETVQVTDMDKEWLSACSNLHVERMTELICACAQLVNKRDFFSGYAAIHWAVKAGSSDVVKLLMENGASVSTKTNGGYTPLHLAYLHDHKRLATDLVLQYGASTEVRDHSGKKPAQYARPSDDELDHVTVEEDHVPDGRTSSDAESNKPRQRRGLHSFSHSFSQSFRRRKSITGDYTDGMSSPFKRSSVSHLARSRSLRQKSTSLITALTPSPRKKSSTLTPLLIRHPHLERRDDESINGEDDVTTDASGCESETDSNSRVDYTESKAVSRDDVDRRRSQSDSQLQRPVTMQFNRARSYSQQPTSPTRGTPSEGDASPQETTPTAETTTDKLSMDRATSTDLSDVRIFDDVPSCVCASGVLLPYKESTTSYKMENRCSCSEARYRNSELSSDSGLSVSSVESRDNDDDFESNLLDKHAFEFLDGGDSLDFLSSSFLPAWAEVATSMQKPRQCRGADGGCSGKDEVKALDTGHKQVTGETRNWRDELIGSSESKSRQYSIWI